MKFSVVVPVYNVEEYLQECIESVIHQTYQNYEIILVNDGSVDKSGEICDGFANRYPKTVKVVHKANQGQLLARIDGLKYATGEIVLFLDSDDCIRKDTLELLKQEFDETNCDMLVFNASTTPDYRKPFRSYPWENRQIFEGADKKQVYELMATTSILNNVCLKAVKAEIFPKKMDYSEISFVKSGEDLLFSLPLITNASKILFLNENLYYYRQRQSSITHVFDRSRTESIKTVHSLVEKYIDMWGMQTLKPKHNARKVRGWVDTLWLFLSSDQKAGSVSYEEMARTMAEDAYFREAFENMDRGSVTAFEYTIAWLLYHKQLQAARVACYLSKIVSKAKRILQPG